MIQPLWRTVWRFLLKKKTRNKSTIWPNNPTTGHIPWENHNWKRHTYPNVHYSIFTIVRTWKQPRCPLTDEWIKKVVVHIYNGVLLSHIKEHIWVSPNEVNEPRTCYTEWSKSEREKQILYINGYIWNLERWYWWIYLQGSNGDADIENRFVDTAGDGEGGTNWENSMETYTLPYVK